MSGGRLPARLPFAGVAACLAQGARQEVGSSDVARDGVAITSDAEFPSGWTARKGNPVLDVGPPGGVDETYAHQPFIVIAGGRLHHFHTAVGSRGRNIALAACRL